MLWANALTNLAPLGLISICNQIILFHWNLSEFQHRNQRYGNPPGDFTSYLTCLDHFYDAHSETHALQEDNPNPPGLFLWVSSVGVLGPEL